MQIIVASFTLYTHNKKKSILIHIRERENRPLFPLQNKVGVPRMSTILENLIHSGIVRVQHDRYETK